MAVSLMLNVLQNNETLIKTIYVPLCAAKHPIRFIFLLAVYFKSDVRMPLFLSCWIPV